MTTPPGPSPAADASYGSTPREPAGVRQSVREMLALGLSYLRARGALFGLEASAAAGHFGRVAAAVLVALLGGVLTYLIVWIMLVLWVARRWAGGDVLPPLAVAAAVHALAAGAAVWWLVARGRKQELFPATCAEFAEDQKWLHHPKP